MGEETCHTARLTASWHVPHINTSTSYDTAKAKSPKGSEKASA